MRTTEERDEYYRQYYIKNRERILADRKRYSRTRRFKILAAMRKIPKDKCSPLTDNQKYARDRIVQELKIQGELSMADRLLSMK